MTFEELAVAAKDPDFQPEKTMVPEDRAVWLCLRGIAVRSREQVSPREELLKEVDQLRGLHRCFTETSGGQYRLRPLYYVTDADKAWYKEYYGIRYSDAYEVYGLTRTGCCGCAISASAAADLEKIRPFEPNLVKAAWHVFGASYEYRRQYDEYRRKRMAEDRKRAADDGQLRLL